MLHLSHGGYAQQQSAVNSCLLLDGCRVADVVQCSVTLWAKAGGP